jgi:hypothetical protein
MLAQPARPVFCTGVMPALGRQMLPAERSRRVESTNTGVLIWCPGFIGVLRNAQAYRKACLRSMAWGHDS